jgi:hypothetical protein
MSVFSTIILIILGALLLVTLITQFVGYSAEASNPRKGKLTKVTGGSIHWMDEGTGPAVVMIHGLGGNLQNFTYAGGRGAGHIARTSPYDCRVHSD